MIRRPPRSTRTYTLFPYTTLFRSIRFGIRRFWAEEGPAPRILALEVAPVLILLGMILVLTLRADAVLGYTRATADLLLEPAIYRKAVLKDASRLDAAPAQNHVPVTVPEDAQ